MIKEKLFFCLEIVTVHDSKINILFRIEDFVVHEVDLNGNTVTLKSLEPTIINEKVKFFFWKS